MNKLIFICLFLLVAIPSLIVKMNLDNDKIVEFSAAGTIVDIIWESRNHGMPILRIKQEGRVKEFASNRITLKKEDVKVGDKFVKIAGSKYCLINDKKVKCVI